MDVEALEQLRKGVREWARTYVSLTEALVHEGVPEEIARKEARDAANMAAWFLGGFDDDETGE